jgi:hypothetical protein
MNTKQRLRIIDELASTMRHLCDETYDASEAHYMATGNLQAAIRAMGLDELSWHGTAGAASTAGMAVLQAKAQRNLED